MLTSIDKSAVCNAALCPSVFWNQIPGPLFW